MAPARFAIGDLAGDLAKRAPPLTPRRDCSLTSVGRALRQSETDAQRDHCSPRRLPQAADQRGTCCRAFAYTARRKGDHDVGKRVERDRNGAKHHELQGDMACGRIDELRNEARKKPAVLGFSASTSAPSRKARRGPIGVAADAPSNADKASRRADRNVRSPSQAR